MKLMASSIKTFQEELQTVRALYSDILTACIMVNVPRKDYKER